MLICAAPINRYQQRHSASAAASCGFGNDRNCESSQLFVSESHDDHMMINCFVKHCELCVNKAVMFFTACTRSMAQSSSFIIFQATTCFNSRILFYCTCATSLALCFRCENENDRIWLIVA